MNQNAFNIPNTLAWLRIACAPLLFFLLLERSIFLDRGIHVEWVDYAAVLIFAFAAITDFFDGYIARRFDMATPLGEILDPLADKLLVLAAFLGLMMIDRANAWIVLAILTREFFITGLRVAAASAGRSVAAGSWGKWKTGLQITAIIFLILDWFPGTWLLYGALIITLYSGYEYVRGYAKAVGAK